MIKVEVIESYNRQYVVRLLEGSDAVSTHLCILRKSVSQAVVGDILMVQQKQGTLVAYEKLARKNQVARSDGVKTKTLAANVAQIILIIAPEPRADLAFISRALCLAHNAKVPLYVVVNKSDLAEKHAKLIEQIQVFDAVAANILSFSKVSNQGLTELEALLKGKRSLLLGVSGSGKSSIVNTLLRQQAVRTAEISHKRNSGRHTTTNVKLHTILRLGAKTEVIDTPGFSRFGLQHLSLSEVQAGFGASFGVENCRFYNCRHLEEPGCGVRELAVKGHKMRYSHYRDIAKSLSSSTRS